MQKLFYFKAGRIYLMKKITFLLACVVALSLSAFAQTKANFAGTWELDKANSKLDERQAKSIESQTLTITQTEKEITVAVKTKRMPPPEMKEGDKPKPDGAAMPPPNGGGQPPMGGGEGRGRGEGMGGGQGGQGRGGMGGGRGGMMGGGDTTTTYSADGKETTIQQDSPMGQVPATLKAKFDKNTLKLSRSSTFETPMGEMTTTSKETYTLSTDGNTLTVKREMETPRGSFSSESTYKKSVESPKM
jgi:hypothetical protein